MIYQGTENNDIVVNLLTQANDTGWSILPGGIAQHISCNSGFITLLGYPIIAGHTYTVTYTILTISGGTVYTLIGDNDSSTHSSPDIYIDTITAVNSDPIKIHSNANCTVQLFNVKDVTLDDAVTIIYSALNKNWSDNRTLYPDFGLSIYERAILSQNGDIYFQQNGADDRNNFFGTAYQSSIKFVDAKNPDSISGFESLNYQANMLMVTTQDGVTTSLGQVSTLIDTDFIKEKLQSAGLEVINYQKDNVYSASFLPDSNEDAVNGSALRGNYCIVELITVDGSTPLKLFSVEVKTAHIPIGPR